MNREGIGPGPPELDQLIGIKQVVEGEGGDLDRIGEVGVLFFGCGRDAP